MFNCLLSTCLVYPLLSLPKTLSYLCQYRPCLGECRCCFVLRRHWVQISTSWQGCLVITPNLWMIITDSMQFKVSHYCLIPNYYVFTIFSKLASFCATNSAQTTVFRQANSVNLFTHYFFLLYLFHIRAFSYLFVYSLITCDLFNRMLVAPNI